MIGLSVCPSIYKQFYKLTQTFAGSINREPLPDYVLEGQPRNKLSLLSNSSTIGFRGCLSSDCLIPQDMMTPIDHSCRILGLSN